MQGKSACGGCGSSTGCGCGTPNPYEQNVEVIWHDPTKYDVLKHGPSFLPKLASTQKAEVRAFVKQAAYYDTGSPVLQTTIGGAALPWLLSFMRALAHIHQTHHWQTGGPTSYSDHLLFERLYNESLEPIDQVAERIVGSTDPEGVKAHQQIDWMHQLVKLICAEDATSDSSEQKVQHSLRGEALFLNVLAACLESQSWSPGTHNLLEGVADKHEVFTYLLKQRLGGGQAAYSYDRG